MKIIVLNLLSFLILPSYSFTQSIKIENVETVLNSHFNLNLDVDSEKEIIAYQFDLKLPNEIEYIDSVLITDIYSDHQISVIPLSGNVLRVLCFSLSNSVLKKDRNRILSFSCRSKDILGQFLCELSEVIIVGENGDDILENYINGYITVKNIKKNK